MPLREPRPDLVRDGLPRRPTLVPPPEFFGLSADGGKVVRVVQRRDGTRSRTEFTVESTVTPDQQNLAAAADLAFLRSKLPPVQARGGKIVRVADLFAGCGAMSLGVREACRALGLHFVPALAVEVDSSFLRTYEANFPNVKRVFQDVLDVCDGALGSPASRREREVKKLVGQVHVLVGGPPCQGHSDLNNRTRRADPKNALYARMARFAELFSPEHVLIENVPAVLHDHGKVVDVTRTALRRLGYQTADGVVSVETLGVPQSRRRHLLLASRRQHPSLATFRSFGRTPRTVRWAIADVTAGDPNDHLTIASRATKVAGERIAHLFENDCYDLPDEMRPECHRDRDHTYRSVYGRLRWDRPAQTITSGFGCMGQGRYVHPAERRTLTPREAARLQFIPDFFVFPPDLRRTEVATMIGNAVPPKLSYVAAIELLR